MENAVYVVCINGVADEVCRTLEDAHSIYRKFVMDARMSGLRKPSVVIYKITEELVDE